MIALDASHLRPAPAARRAHAATLLAESGEPAAFPSSVPAARAATATPPRVAFTTAPVLLPEPGRGWLTPSVEARILRRVRRVVRRRLRVEVAGIVSATISDGHLEVRLETVSPRDPQVIEWTANRLVALVVLSDGCGSRILGGGGLMGRIELPSVACPGASLAFCYDADPAVRRS